MLFQSTAQTVVLNALQGIIDQNNTQRKNETVKRLDYYRSNQAQYIKEELEKTFANADKLTPLFVNLVRKIVDNLAMVYCKPAKREVEGTQRDTDIYNEVWETANLDVVMKQASRLTKLLKTILLRAVWRNGKLELDILTGDIIDVEVGDSPRDLQKVLVTHYPASGKAEEITYSLWTPENYQRLDYRGYVVEEMENPYQRLPFVSLWDSMPIDSFWIDDGQDIIDAQTAINERLTDLCHVLRWQGFGVGYRKDETGAYKNEIDIGPGEFVNLSCNQYSEIGFAQPQAPIEETVNAIEFIMNQVAIANGLSAHSLTAKPVNESGVSKIVSNNELMEKRRDDIALFRKYEHDLFELIKVVWNTHNPGRQFSTNAQLSIDFAELKSPTVEMDEAARWEQLISMGQASMVDFAIGTRRKQRI